MIDVKRLDVETAAAARGERPSDFLGRCVLDICDKILNRAGWSGYGRAFKEDMRSYAVETLFRRAIYRFDPGLGSSFSFLYKTVFTAFRVYVRDHVIRERHERSYRKEYLGEYAARSRLPDAAVEYAQLVKDPAFAGV